VSIRFAAPSSDSGSEPVHHTVAVPARVPRLAAEDGLVELQREEPLERDEDARIEQQVEYEEIESEPGVTPALALDIGSGRQPP
jgi:hypothetical protein